MKIKNLKFFFLVLGVLQIFYIFTFRSNFEFQVFKDPFSVDSGIVYALSEEVRESRQIIKKKKLKHFNLSKNIQKDLYLYHRIVEFNYPVKFKTKSQFLFLLNEKETPKECNIVEKGQHLILAECSNV